MAEARVAIHPVPAVGQDGLRVDYNNHVLQTAVTGDGVVLYIPHPRYIIRNIRRGLHRFRNKMANACWPAPLPLIYAVVAGFTLKVITSDSHSWWRNNRIAHIIWNADSRLPGTHRLPVWVRVMYQSQLWGIWVMLCVMFVNRALLRALLRYKGWLEEGTRPSTLTLIWGGVLRAWYISAPKQLYSFQRALPPLPIPTVKDTCNRFLQSVKPLMTDDEYAAIEKECREFQKGPAGRLQGYLSLRWWLTDNYVSDWWLKFVYLRGRGSLMINSNYYGLGAAKGAANYLLTTSQTARAAAMIYQFMCAKRSIDREQLEPFCLNGTVPLCMAQYDRLFSHTRIPGLECDHLEHYDNAQSRHVAVFHKGHWYKLVVYRKTGELVPPYDLQLLLKGIVEDAGRDGMPPPPPVCALTTMERPKWAEVRERYFTTGVNRMSLDVIESAIFCVHLDQATPTTASEEARELFHSDGKSLWMDKSFTLSVFANGQAGIHVEHSWGDAPVIAHIWEQCHHKEVTGRPYDANGNIARPDNHDHSSPVHAPAHPPPQRLMWNVPPELAKTMESAAVEASKAIADVEVRVECHDAFGKGFIKSVKMSPDAFVQMALQLAYFRDQGKFCLTYEASMTRLFCNGRTETVRSLSADSCAWVRAMEDPSAPRETRVQLLQKAIDSHSKYAKDAMCGKGCDRHLFALYVVSVGRKIDAPFLTRALSLPFTLSTSQVPQRQTPKAMWPEGDPGDIYYSPSGGFGPVADDGYGVSYCIAGEKRIFFHVSSKKAASTTSSNAFMEHIFRALADMQTLMRPPS